VALPLFQNFLLFPLFLLQMATSPSCHGLYASEKGHSTSYVTAVAAAFAAPAVGKRKGKVAAAAISMRRLVVLPAGEKGAADSCQASYFPTGLVVVAMELALLQPLLALLALVAPKLLLPLQRRDQSLADYLHHSPKVPSSGAAAGAVAVGVAAAAAAAALPLHLLLHLRVKPQGPR